MQCRECGGSQTTDRPWPEPGLCPLCAANVTVYDRRPTLPKLPTVCCRTGCKENAEYQPVILLWAKGDWKKKPTTCLRMEIGMSVCAEHGRALRAADLLTDDGWERIRAAVVTLGKAEPSRESAVVELKPIG